MSKATLTVEGFVAKDPEVRYHEGKAVVNVSVPHTPRKLNKQSNQWEDAGPTLWVQASFWERDAEAIAAVVRKGSLVTITGQPELNVYTKQDGGVDAQLRLKFGTLAVIPREEHEPRASSSPAQADSWSAAAPGSFGDDTSVPF